MRRFRSAFHTLLILLVFSVIASGLFTTINQPLVAQTTVYAPSGLTTNTIPVASTSTAPYNVINSNLTIDGGGNLAYPGGSPVLER